MRAATVTRAASAIARSAGDDPRTSPRAIAAYLNQIRPVVGDATDRRQVLLRQVGQLIENARHGNAALIAQGAGKVGREHVVGFQETRGEVDGVRVPNACAACHAALTKWLDSLIGACDGLMEVGITGNLQRIHLTEERLAEGRVHARRFNAEHAHLVGDVRQRVAANDRPRIAS